ncbi:hypothetical protein [Rubinisphaera brasiliensis]|uniref:Uncharacterized protein n=1 Tax=Rubinisphaera brasiliensis (strain ATCC 49424 / DSM 5305 / JCM 21570 / IAM 15109 / NBRC 103401 / IFAM 1448) TaxID=756272 RepID=F0SNK7_RUBBR|nr:hypothetical protein [Rubinisphaera brasiliensis]ADY57841.1 hypothetical protein Plabr_0212 [Rubinisphaera brasiliensis DSM 5305]
MSEASGPSKDTDSITVGKLFDWGLKGLSVAAAAGLVHTGQLLWSLENRVTVIEHTAYTHKDAQIERERTDAKLEEIRELIVSLGKEVSASNHGPLFVNLTKQVEAMTAEMREVNKFLRERP